MILLDGKATSQKMRDRLKEELLSSNEGRAPHLAVILVGDDPASQVYVRNKEKACEYVGIQSTTYRMPADTKQEELLNRIQVLNIDDTVDGILLQLPLPKGLDSQACIEAISPLKDVDGLHPENQGRLAVGLPGIRPCTPSGVMSILVEYGIDMAGKNVVVLGRSNLVGKPIAVMCVAADATVTHCHSKTKNLKAICREADIIVAAIGKPNFITKDYVKEGVIIADVGINRTENGLVGDVDFDDVKDLCHAITPVPGGIGPMTIVQLLVNTIAAKKLREKGQKNSSKNSAHFPV